MRSPAAADAGRRLERARHFSTRAPVDARQQRQQPARARSPRGRRQTADAKSISTGRPSSSTSTLLRWRRSRWTTPRACISRTASRERVDEARRHARRRGGATCVARPVLDREGERVDAPEQARHRRVSRQRAIGAQLAAREPAPERGAHPASRAARSPSPRRAAAISASSTSGLRALPRFSTARVRAARSRRREGQQRRFGSIRHGASVPRASALSVGAWYGDRGGSGATGRRSATAATRSGWRCRAPCPRAVAAAAP